jgi:hypothetical protein
MITNPAPKARKKSRGGGRSPGSKAGSPAIGLIEGRPHEPATPKSPKPVSAAKERKERKSLA